MKKILLFIACCLFTAAYGQGSRGSLSFAGPVSGSYRGVNLPGAIIGTRSTYTWEGWVFPDLQAGGTLTGHLVYSEGTPLLTLSVYVDSGGSFQFGIWNNGWNILQTATSAIAFRQWNHLAVTRQANGTTTMYINGSAVLTQNSHLQTNANRGALGINTGFVQQIWGGEFQGQIDEVRIWSRALSQDEIRHKMTERLAGTEPGLVAYYRLDEGTDDTYPGGQDVCDASGNGNHGVKF
ncbi:MAG: LamG domain-containing protein [Bacteroidetes bacterium]|jgi:hypothetical protein|nr:LamG domain-containing protein [Bacteroidota bacterium]